MYLFMFFFLNLCIFLNFFISLKFKLKVKKPNFVFYTLPYNFCVLRQQIRRVCSSHGS